MDIITRIREEISPHLATLGDIEHVADADPEQGLDHLARFVASLIRDGAASTELREIIARLDRIEQNQEKIMTAQDDVNAAVAFDTQLDTDIKAATAQIIAGQAALDTTIVNLQNAGVDTTQLKAVQLVLAGDQPTLDAAVAALAADPNLTPTTPAAPAQAPSGDGTDGSAAPSA